jgi:hypothetical protein
MACGLCFHPLYGAPSMRARPEPRITGVPTLIKRHPVGGRNLSLMKALNTERARAQLTPLARISAIPIAFPPGPTSTCPQCSVLAANDLPTNGPAARPLNRHMTSMHTTRRCRPLGSPGLCASACIWLRIICGLAPRVNWCIVGWLTGARDHPDELTAILADLLADRHKRLNPSDASSRARADLATLAARTCSNSGTARTALAGDADGIRRDESVADYETRGDIQARLDSRRLRGPRST